MAIISIRKALPGPCQKRLMFGLWAFLPPVHVCTKFIVVTDDDVGIRRWDESGPSAAHGPGARHHAGGEHADHSLDFASRRWAAWAAR